MKKEVVLGITGSIAAYKACDIIRQLKDEGFSVSVILTKEAERFITALTLETLSGNKVYQDMFEIPTDWQPNHISLARKADLILIAPATANVISQIACGICDDLLTTTVCASTAPVLIAPAMDENMFLNKIIQGNIKKLENLGHKFVGPIKGRLASGKIGVGHLAKVEDIVDRVKKILA
ncbi:MAG: flavoprotein [Candidatus Omnitrophota bacterium]